MVKFRILKYSLALFLVSAFSVSASAARNISYVDAYKLCSPVAHQMAKEQCNFGRVYEHYYQYCMNKSGFSESEDSESAEYYEKYMKAYKGCANTADSNTKNYCGYGKLYNSQYNRCMAKNGYGANGEELAGGSSSGQYFEFDY